MDDFLKEHFQRVRQVLSPPEPEPVRQVAEALCFPAFHPETLLRVVDRTEGSTILFRTTDSGLWGSEESTEPTEIEERTFVPFERAKQFWDAMSELNPVSIRPMESCGCDGMSINAMFQAGDQKSEFETWSPELDTPEGRFVELIYDLAWDVLQTPEAVLGLEHLHCYLKKGPGVTVTTGSVNRLRIFGSLSFGDEGALLAYFSEFDLNEPLLVDMTNFDGMGTCLYPEFIKFANSHQNIAWAVSPNARHHVEAMRFPKETCFDTTDDAIQWLNRP
ncbi:hypothetical protein [Blastopirellula marina]|uniref:Uncharacterized protein n=1 Tax=Blastopirellula marina TaxID=124 RepID=A0A2S8GBX2_9BACT|nr:hypothetical protein [Blastopirellula marina]PQO41923.1 hypothetical protein C5Y98_02480 [Blastopirellula marina]PTL46281.1 hypothetical protein C5Y97_02480 [Blastopirellula marina]